MLVPKGLMVLGQSVASDSGIAAGMTAFALKVGGRGYEVAFVGYDLVIFRRAFALGASEQAGS